LSVPIIEKITPQLDLIIDARVSQWVAAHIPGLDNANDFGPHTSLGIGMNGEIIAGMVYNNWHPGYKSVELAMAATRPDWARRATISKLLGYPFLQLGVQRVTTLIRASNDRALRLNAGLGFVREGVIRQGYGDEDMIVMGLLRSDAEKWIRGQESTHAARSLPNGGGTDTG
jgi:RimJ/RimL family protein N-acetyltransferase